jgi:hypothetical protein
MKRKLIFSLLMMACAFVSQAQTADEIIAKYHENTGGVEKWKALQGMKMTTILKVQAMELPMEAIQLKDGKSYSVMKAQGMEFKQNVFDGTTLWGTNQMTMKAEKSTAEETENHKNNDAKDFPDSFLDYKKKGYKVELIGKETMEGTETFKIKLTKNPIKVDGKETENVTFYYFDTENYVPLMQETEMKSGQMKGMVMQIKTSDFQDVNGLMFPFSMSQGVKGQPGGASFVVTKIELNPKVDASIFAFPAATPGK